MHRQEITVFVFPFIVVDQHDTHVNGKMKVRMLNRINRRNGIQGLKNFLSWDNETIVAIATVAIFMIVKKKRTNRSRYNHKHNSKFNTIMMKMYQRIVAMDLQIDRQIDGRITNETKVHVVNRIIMSVRNAAIAVNAVIAQIALIVMIVAIVDEVVVIVAITTMIVATTRAKKPIEVEIIIDPVAIHLNLKIKIEIETVEAATNTMDAEIVAAEITVETIVITSPPATLNISTAATLELLVVTTTIQITSNRSISPIPNCKRQA